MVCWKGGTSVIDPSHIHMPALFLESHKYGVSLLPKSRLIQQSSCPLCCNYRRTNYWERGRMAVSSPRVLLVFGGSRLQPDSGSTSS